MQNFLAKAKKLGSDVSSTVKEKTETVVKQGKDKMENMKSHTPQYISVVCEPTEEELNRVLHLINTEMEGADIQHVVKLEDKLAFIVKQS